jgi:hypothetical protein
VSESSFLAGPRPRYLPCGLSILYYTILYYTTSYRLVQSHVRVRSLVDPLSFYSSIFVAGLAAGLAGLGWLAFKEDIANHFPVFDRKRPEPAATPSSEIPPQIRSSYRLPQTQYSLRPSSSLYSTRTSLTRTVPTASRFLPSPLCSPLALSPSHPLTLSPSHPLSPTPRFLTSSLPHFLTSSLLHFLLPNHYEYSSSLLIVCAVNL